MLTFFAKLLGILNSDTEPKFIALAITLAMMAGLSPTFSLVTLLVIALLILLRAHLATFFALYAVFSLVAVLLSPVISMLGEYLLVSENLQQTWQSLYQSVWFRLFEYNDTFHMGSAVLAVALIIPTYLVSILLIKAYREKFMAFVNKFQIVKSLKASKFYKVYEVANQD